MFKADLHCHSTFSDGSLDPKELLNLAKSIGLSGLSLTDHDTFEGFFFGKDYAEEIGMKWLPGIEISTEYQNKNVHLLAYSFDPYDTAFGDFCTNLKNSRKSRNLGILKLLSKLGMEITEEELASEGAKGSIGRPHIANVLIKKGYVNSVNEAFRKYLGDGKPAYFEQEKVKITDAIERVHKAGGYAILAHPHLIRDANLVDRLLHLPLDGIECFYSRFPRSREEKWLSIVKKKNWIATGGSDFHGASKPETNLGISWVESDIFDILWKRWKEHTK